MTRQQNWGIEKDATDYFGHQKKQLDVADRRPVIRKPSDLVGPGINASAVRITDYNDLLATFDGYYSSDSGALQAPNDADPFVGTVVMDDTLGGRQVFTSLTTGEQFTRIFLRNPSDASAITWGVWRPDEHQPASVFNIDSPSTVVDINGTPISAPLLNTFGTADTFGRVPAAIEILRPGVYTGYIRLDGSGDALTNLTLEYPDGSSIASEAINLPNLVKGIYVPLHFYTTGTTGYIQITVDLTASTQTVTWTRLALSRIGDAPAV